MSTREKGLIILIRKLIDVLRTVNINWRSQLMVDTVVQEAELYVQSIEQAG